MKKITLFGRELEFVPFNLTHPSKLPPIVKSRKYFLILIGVYILVLSGLFVVRANWGFNNGLILNVTAIGKGLGSYKNQQLTGQNSFVSGVKGDLYWKPGTLIESMLLITCNNDGTDFFDITGILITACVIFFMFKKSQDSALFNKNITMGFMLLIFVMAIMAMLIGMAKFELAFEYIPYITHGQFQTNIGFKVLSYNYMVYPLLLFLLRIPQKGLELQQEAELTI